MLLLIFCLLSFSFLGTGQFLRPQRCCRTKAFTFTRANESGTTRYCPCVIPAARTDNGSAPWSVQSLNVAHASGASGRASLPQPVRTLALVPSAAVAGPPRPGRKAKWRNSEPRACVLNIDARMATSRLRYSQMVICKLVLLLILSSTKENNEQPVLSAWEYNPVLVASNCLWSCGISSLPINISRTPRWPCLKGTKPMPWPRYGYVYPVTNI